MAGNDAYRRLVPGTTDPAFYVRARHRQGDSRPGRAGCDTAPVHAHLLRVDAAGHACDAHRPRAGRRNRGPVHGTGGAAAPPGAWAHPTPTPASAWAPPSPTPSAI